MFKETELANKKYELIQIHGTTKIHHIFFSFVVHSGFILILCSKLNHIMKTIFSFSSLLLKEIKI